MDDQNFNKIQFSLNFRNPRHCFIKSANFFCFCFTMYTKRKSSQLKYKMGVKRPENLVSYFLYFSTYLLILYLQRGPCNFIPDPDGIRFESNNLFSIMTIHSMKLKDKSFFDFQFSLLLLELENIMIADKGETYFKLFN